MTRFVLAGGYPWKASDGGAAFVQACLAPAKKTATILICLFARAEAEWQQGYKDDVTRFTAHSAGSQLHFVLASRDTFAAQVQRADIIYLRGGNTQQLVTALCRDKAWLQYLDGKTVVGTSAGADAIATYYYGLDELRIGGGLGLLPIKVLVHYESDYGNGSIDWQKAYWTLDSYGQKLELVAIREGEFIVR